jgi:hypothetical protein
MKQIILISMISFLLFSCGNSGSKNGDADNTEPSQTDSDILQSDIPLEALEIKTEIKSSAECKTHEDCKEKGDGMGCDCNSQCIKASCLENKNCGSDKYCDPCDLTCKIFKEVCEPCANDYECNYTGSSCLDYKTGGRFCGRGCLSAYGCDKYYNCVEIEGLEYKQCIPVSEKCEKLAQCEKDMDCEFGQVCNTVKGLCYKGCENDIECGGKVCSAGKCSDPCDDGKNPCPEGQVCENGHCKIPGGCLTPYDCHDPETYCDPEENKCKPGCIFDFDCKSVAKMCVQGQCVQKGCTGNFECAYFEVCNLQTGQCAKAEGKYCEPCDQNNGENACGDKEIMCIGFQDKDGNKIGDYCMPPCGPDPENPCPQGWQCQEIKDDQGKSYGKKCIRFCYVNPVGEK